MRILIDISHPAHAHFFKNAITDFKKRGEVENQIEEGENTLRWDNTSCDRFPANEARLKMGFLAYNLLHLIRRFYLWGEDARRSIKWIITRLAKAGVRIVYHAKRWHVHVASAFPLGLHYRAVLDWQAEDACTEIWLAKIWSERYF